MWCPSDLAYTIKVYIVWCDGPSDLAYTIKKVYCLMWYPINQAYTIKECMLFDVMSIWPSLHN